MLINRILIFFSLFLPVCFSSCTVYMPQAVPVPLMSHKHELHLSAGLVAGPGAMASVCYSPLNHLAFQLYGSSAVRHVQYSQFAPGYYNSLGKGFRYEVFGGVGFGSGNYPKTSGDKTVGSIKGNYSLAFIQLNAGGSYDGRLLVEYGGGVKTGIFDSRFLDALDLQPAEQYSMKAMLLEPSVFIRTGRFVMVGLQFNYSYIGKLSNVQHAFPHAETMLAFTLGFHFRGKKMPVSRRK